MYDLTEKLMEYTFLIRYVKTTYDNQKVWNLSPDCHFRPNAFPQTFNLVTLYL